MHFYIPSQLSALLVAISTSLAKVNQSASQVLIEEAILNIREEAIGESRTKYTF